MAGENTEENPVVAELKEICRELERRGWTGTKIQKWFGGGHNKPFDGVITELWVDVEDGPPAIMAHINFEDGDEEDVSLAEAANYVVDKEKKQHMAQDVEQFGKKKKKKDKSKRPFDDSASEDNSSAKGGRAVSSSGGGGGGAEAKRQKVSKDGKEGKPKEKKTSSKEAAPKKASRGSGSESEKSRAGSSKGKRQQGGEGEGVEEGDGAGVKSSSKKGKEEGNMYVEALQQLFREGRLHAGQAKIAATFGEERVCAELQEDGQIKQQGDEGEPVYFVSPEEFAAMAFPHADVKELGITINEMPLQRVEDEMLPPLGLPPGLEGALAVDDATARKWVCNMEEALSLLELVYNEAAVAARQRKRREAASQASGSPPRAAVNGEGESLSRAGLLDPSMREHSRDQLRKLVERVHQFVQAAAPPQDAQLATMAEVDSRVRKAFGLELARLNWVTQSHAKIEKKLASLLEGDETDEGHREIQEEVAASLGVEAGSLVDRTTPFSMHVAQLTDFRFQLRCMLKKAKELVSVRQTTEERYMRQALASFGRQKNIVQGVRSQQKDMEKRRDDESKGLECRMAAIEQEVQLLSEALQAKKEQLEKEKAALHAKRRVFDGTVTLLGEKKDRWSGKMDQTRGAHRASAERLLVLKEVNTYLEGMCVEPCIRSQLQHFLNSLCTECCKAWSRKAHATDARARCRTRLAYEIFGLIKRLWGGNITVVVDMNKISAAFTAVFANMEAEVSMWQGMPLPLASPLALDGTPNLTLKVLRQQPKDGDATARPTFRTEPLDATGAKASTPILEADVVSGLGYKTLLLALAPSDLTTAAIRRADELASQLDSAMDVSPSSSLSSPRPHHLLLLPTPPSPLLPVPPFLLECLLLSHAQEYLAITARAAKNNTTPQEEASHCELNGESMLLGEATLDSDAIKTRPLPHSEGLPLLASSPTWWEEVTDGRTSSFIPANAFGDAMVAATLVCKAVDAVMIANFTPPAPETPTPAEADGNAAAEQEPQVDPSHPSTNALVCLKTLGQQAGRYGAPLKHMTPQEQHVVNYVPVAIMYARIVWAIRRVAVVDVGRSLTYGTLNCLSGDHDALFACLHTDMPEDDAPERPDALLHSLLRSDATVAEVLRELVTDKLRGVMDDFLPELVIVSASLRPEHNRVTVTPEDLEYVVGEMAKVAQRHCTGRLVVVLDGAAYNLPLPTGQPDVTGERMGACLRALKASKLGVPTTVPEE